jgi:hypothetical protein
MRRTSVVFCALAVVLSIIAAGCSEPPKSKDPREVDTIETASSPSPNPTPEDSFACKLLTNKERRSIAGEPISYIAPASPSKGAAVCRWVKTLKSALPTQVVVLVAPAQVWAKSVPTQVDGALRSGRAANDKDLFKKLLAARKRITKGADTLTDKEACGMFSLLAQSNGRKKGVKETISFPPNSGGVSAQARTCYKGIYATVTYSEIGLQPSSALSAAVLRLVRIVRVKAAALNYANDVP